MAIALNSYASKAYSEHPIAMWPMDDDAYFLSLINPSDRLFSTWSFSTASATVSYNIYDNNTTYLPDIVAPFKDDVYSTVFMNSSSASYLLTATSNNLFSASNLDLNKESFCINFFLHQDPTSIQWFKVGYKYIDNLSVEKTVISEQISAPLSKSWLNFNYTYSIPSDIAGSVKIFFQVMFNSNADISSRKLTINGLSVGQWSETHCYNSLGSIDQELPSDTGIYSVTGIPADQYGILSDNGYYVIENNSILAQNDGPPLIFGTDNCTKIKPSIRQNPSFIFPGKGMLNETGRYNDYSLEMWIQIKPSTNISRKIVGPLNSNYGIYVREGFISILIGNNILSHSVGEWYRPMLINFNIKNNIASLLINGETVISINYDRENVDLPVTNDWWGIYSYSDIEIFKIDCISIYPYSVSEIIAKRRFVWGQGTTSSQFIDDQFSGVPISIDFSTSEYTSNTIYPDIEQWNAAYFENMVATNNSISIPNYSLPTIFLNGRDIDEWYEYNKYVNKIEYLGIDDHPKFITFRPNIKTNNIDSYIYGREFWTNESWINFSSTHELTDSLVSEFGVLPSFEQDSVSYNSNNWDDEYYINFPSLNILTEPVAAIFGVFEIDKNIPSARPLMTFINTITNNKFAIEINGLNILYKFNDVEIYRDSVKINNHFCVGINLQAISQNYGYEIANFFASLSSIQLFVGGDKINTFEGKIYKVGFSSLSNYSQVQSSFNQNGFTKIDDYDLLLSNNSSYILFALETYDKLSLDISVYSTWEEYFPLSKFAGYVSSASGLSYYDVDFFQTNISYPTIALQIEWRYNDLKNLSLTYSGLENNNYLNYNSLKNNNTSGETIDTSNSSLQMYMTFQQANQNTIEPLDNFIYTKKLTSDLVIRPDNENTIVQPLKAYETKFEFKNNVIVYPPKTLNFEEIAVVFHFVINQKGIISSPLKISNFEITSRALNENSNNLIGTKFGNKIIPYVKTYSASSSIIDYKEENPITIYKRSTPYLYMTENSGIKVVNNEDNYQANTRTNLITNPSFELNTDGWSSNSGSSYIKSASASKFGAMSCLVTQVPTENSGLILTNSIPVTVGEQYTISTYLKGESSSQEVLLNVHQLSSSGSIICQNNSGSINLTASAGWTRYSVTFTAASAVASIRPMVIHPNTAISGNQFYVDGWMFEKSNLPDPYFDGNVSEGKDYSFLKWNDSANSSTSTIFYGKEYLASIPINTNLSNDYRVGAIQLWGMYDNELFSSSVLTLYEINSLERTLQFYAEKNNNEQRAIIKVRDKFNPSRQVSDVVFYQNGTIVKNPIISPKEWNCIGILFNESLVFDNYTGNINLFGETVFNNISYYEISGLLSTINIKAKTWTSIYQNSIPPPTYFLWSYWSDETWKDIYVSSLINNYAIDPKIIYNTYIGNNRDIIDDGYGLNIGSSTFSTYSSIIWSQTVDKPT